jgi:hypothetical protein
MEEAMEKKRLNMELPVELHQELRLMAIKYNCTMTQYVMRILITQLAEEQKYDGQKQ